MSVTFRGFGNPEKEVGAEEEEAFKFKQISLHANKELKNLTFGENTNYQNFRT